jgi:hypothetical protein
MTLLYRAAGIALGALGMAALAWASHAPMPAHASNDALLRLAWSARPERVEECRQRGEEELAALPPHMRQPLACEGSTAEYRLQVLIDDAIVADRVVHGGGLRRDRRLYVFEELPVAAGETAIEVRFDRIGGTSTTRQGDHVPPHLALQRRVRLSSRQVLLVTYAQDQQALVAVQAPDNAQRR